MAKDTKTTKAEAQVAKALLGRAVPQNTHTMSVADIPSSSHYISPGGPNARSSLEARVAALEAYIERNHKILGWPEFDV